MEKKRRTECNVFITSVTSPAKVDAVSKALGINPQKVFVRVTVKVGENEYSASNQLRFLTQDGYNRLLEAKKSGEEINVTLVLTEGQDEAFIYVNPENKVSVADLFSQPLEKVDNRKNIEDLF